MFTESQLIVGTIAAQELYGNKFGQFATMTVVDVDGPDIYVVTTAHEFDEDCVGEDGWVEANLFVEKGLVDAIGDMATEMPVREAPTPLTPTGISSKAARIRRRR